MGQRQMMIDQIYAESKSLIVIKPDRTLIASGQNDAGQLSIDGSDFSNIAMIATGYQHTLALRQDGTVVAAGTDNLGNCNVGDWSDIVSIAASDCLSIGVRANGTVVISGNVDKSLKRVSAWNDIVQVSCTESTIVGVTRNGDLRLASMFKRSAKEQFEHAFSATAQPVGRWSNLSRALAGDAYCIGLRQDGTVVASLEDKAFQDELSAWFDIVQVALSGRLTIGLKRDGTIVTAGVNHLGAFDSKTWQGNVQIAASDYYAAGLKRDGTVVLQGYNWHDYKVEFDHESVRFKGLHDLPRSIDCYWQDQLSLSEDGPALIGRYRSLDPSHEGLVSYLDRDVKFKATSLPGRDAALPHFLNIHRIAAGENHTVGLKPDGTVIATGNNSYGQCSVENWMDIVSVAAGPEHTVGLKKDGTVVAAGRNDRGQCDVNGWEQIISIAACKCYTLGITADMRVVCAGADAFRKAPPLRGWRQVAKVACCNEEIAAITTSGIVLRHKPSLFHAFEPNWTDVTDIACGSDFVITLASDGWTQFSSIDRAYNETYNECPTEKRKSVAACDKIIALLNEDGSVEVDWFGSAKPSWLSTYGPLWKNIIEIAPGFQHMVGLRSDGSVVAIGSDKFNRCNVSEWQLSAPVSTDSNRQKGGNGSTGSGMAKASKSRIPFLSKEAYLANLERFESFFQSLATDRVLPFVMSFAPRKKDGSLHAGRVQKLCFLANCYNDPIMDEYFTVSENKLIEVFIKNLDSTSCTIEIGERIFTHKQGSFDPSEYLIPDITKFGSGRSRKVTEYVDSGNRITVDLDGMMRQIEQMKKQFAEDRYYDINDLPKILKKLAPKPSAAKN